jgi:hypothetical protein
MWRAGPGPAHGTMGRGRDPRQDAVTGPAVPRPLVPTRRRVRGSVVVALCSRRSADHWTVVLVKADVRVAATACPAPVGHPSRAVVTRTR